MHGRNRRPVRLAGLRPVRLLDRPVAELPVSGHGHFRPLPQPQLTGPLKFLPGRRHVIRSVPGFPPDPQCLPVLQVQPGHFGRARRGGPDRVLVHGDSLVGVGGSLTRLRRSSNPVPRPAR